MLRELVKMWSNHKVMVRYLSRFFQYLDRYFISQRALSGLNEVGLTCFHDQVYQELNGKVRDAVISLILRSDNGMEYTFHQFGLFCEEAWIERQLTAPYTPEQN